MKKFFSKRINKIAVSIAIIACAIVGALFYQHDKKQAEYSKWAESENQKQAESNMALEDEIEKKKETYSFYQKLADGIDVNILIVGDGIGVGEGASRGTKAWKYLLNGYLEKAYGSKVRANNISIEKGSSYSAYVKTMMINDNKDYDLAIICCGQNDEDKDFSLHYETVIRAIRDKYSKCSIISILENPQKKYTEKVKIIQSLAKHYDIPVADTIKTFQEDYDNLTTDVGYPNDEGHKVYFETIKKIIDSNVVSKTAYKLTKIEPVNKDVSKYDEFTWYANNDFTRVNATTGTITIKEKGILGIDCGIKGGKGKIEIYVDGKLFTSTEGPEDPDYFSRHIMKVSEQCEVKEELKIVFADRTQANSFKGICFSR